MAKPPKSGPSKRRVFPSRRHLVAIAAAAVPLAGAAGYFVLAPGEAEANTQIPAVSVPSGPLPVAAVATSRPLRAADYEIVSIYGGEAILAAGSNLVRLKVGSTAPGLGTITAIEAGTEGGGSLTATEATLRTR